MLGLVLLLATTAVVPVRPSESTAAASPLRLLVTSNGSITEPGSDDAVLLRGFTWDFVLGKNQENVTAEDRQVSSLLPGTNLARLVMVHWHDAPTTQTGGDCSSSDASLGFLTAACLAQFDRIVSWATKRMWVTITARASLAAGDGGEGGTVWSNATLRQQMVGMWGFLARRYSGWDRVAGFEVMSEPRVDDAAAIHAFHLDACGAVWAADAAAICFVGPGKFYDRAKLSVEYLLPQSGNRQVVYAANMFDYVADPAGNNNASAVRAALVRKIGMISNFSSTFRVPVWVDQFGVQGDDAGGDAAQATYLEELLQLFAETRFHWSYWIWRRPSSWACPGGYAVDCQLANGTYALIQLKLDALARWLGPTPDPLPPFAPIVPQPPAPEPLAECEAHAKAMCGAPPVVYDACHKCVWGHASDLEEEGCDFDAQHSAIVAFVCGNPPPSAQAPQAPQVPQAPQAPQAAQAAQAAQAQALLAAPPAQPAQPAQPAPRSGGFEFHVCAARGDDGAPGTAARPLRTLPAARDAVRRLERGVGNDRAVASIILHGAAVHHLAAPLLLDARDSHTRYVAHGAAQEKPLVSGGILVDPSATVPRPGHVGQFQVNMTALGLADLGTVLPSGPQTAGGAPPLHPQLFLGEQQTGVLARWPNIRLANNTVQWAYTADCMATASGCFSGCNCSAAGVDGFSWRTNATEGAGVPPAVAHGWAGEPDGYVHGYWEWDWRDGYFPLAGVDAAHGGLLLGGGGGAQLGKAALGARYVAFNLLSELDNDGEYYLSRRRDDHGMLYFQPPPGSWPPSAGGGGGGNDAAAAAAPFYVSSASNLVVLAEGASHVSFEGLSFQHARSTLLTSVQHPTATVSHISVDGCTVANGGGGGIHLQGYGNSVTGSHVFNVGAAGVDVKGGLHRSLTRGGNVVHGNEIHHYAQWVRTYQPGILWAGVGNAYTANYIHDAPHNAILGAGNEATCSGNGTESSIVEAMCGGNDNLFESNVIEHTNFECDDSGAFYTCGQQGTAFVNRGNVLRNNTFRRVRQEDVTFLGYPSVQAIYLDDQMSGWLVENNTVIDAQMGIMVGGGRDTVVRGNSFIGCDKGLHIDNRGMTSEKSACVGPDLTSLHAAMAVAAAASGGGSGGGGGGWAKYGLSDAMAPGGQCSPVNVSATDNCFQGNVQNWELWCGSADCLNDPKWLSKEAGNHNSTACGGQ